MGRWGSCLLATAILLSPAADASAETPSRQPLELKSGSFDPLIEALPVPEALSRAAGERVPARTREGAPLHYIVQFHGSVLSSDTRIVERAGGRVLAYLPEGALIVRIQPSGMEVLSRDARLRWTGRLPPRDRLEPGLLGSNSESIVVTLFPDESADAFREDILPVLGNAGLLTEILGTSSPVLGTFLRLHREGGFGDEDLARLAGQEPVWYVERFHEPRPANDNTIWVGQSHDTVARTNYSVSATIWNHGILGTGQIAAAIDTGLEAEACFFKYDAAGTAPTQFLSPPAVGVVDPDHKVVALYVAPGYDPYANRSHGTGTMGIILGDDFTNLSTPTAHGHDFGDGMAPNAQLVAQVPLAIANNLPDAFAQAYGSGARVHSNSWVSGWNLYTEHCRQADSYVWDHEDFLEVFSGGNTGGAPNNGLINAPSVAKNVVSVGGSSPGSVNDAEDLADRARGPAFDGRIKPDLVAPAAGIVTAGGDGVPETNDCVRAGFGGTSAAAPAVAGLAVLLRQYFTDGFYPSGARDAGDETVPSAALLKACLLNGATPLQGIDPATGAIVDPVPSFNQGWGRVLLDSVLWFAGDPHRTRVWDKRNAAGLITGETDEYAIVASPGEPVEVTLVWTDVPAAPSAAHALVHDLDLYVVAPSGPIYPGNNFVNGVSLPGTVFDSKNNVESVLINNPEAGTYRILVVGRSIPPAGVGDFSDRQGYAVVATFGACSSSVAAPTYLTAEEGGGAGIELAWDVVPNATNYTIYRGDGDCSEAEGRFTVLGQTDATTFLDVKAVGGFRYAYRVRATDGCGESEPSECASAVSTAECMLPPDFAGLQMAEEDGMTCAVRLSWTPATSACPLGSSISYNVYRSTASDFVPSSATLLAAGVQGTEVVDTNAAAGTTYFYIVRAEDSTAVGGGPSNGGNEDGNLRRANATPYGSPGAQGNWFDDGGDTAARFSVSPEWSVSPMQNHTPSGTVAYRSGQPGASYPPGTCSAIVSPPLLLDPAGSSVLSYWTTYNLEDHLDGVVVEVSEDGGPWVDLPPDAGYPGDFALGDEPTGLRVNACGYPATQGAFSGPTGNGGLSGWTRYATDLSARAGKSVRFRFRLSTDMVLEGPEGFFLDDVSVTEVLLPEPCEPCMTPGAVGNTLRVEKVLPADIAFFWTDVPGATGYHLTGSVDRAMGSEDFAADAPDGATGVLHGGALTLDESWFYRVRARGNCGDLGP